MVWRLTAFLMFLWFLPPAAIARQVDSLLIRKSFDKADEYMRTDHYDSAQYYLNKIYKQVSYREPSLFSFFLTSRQAEIYYYNNLPELGLQEATRAIKMARFLKDNILISDAYNFAGLFYLLTHKNKQAIAAFKKALSSGARPPYPTKYLELSEPHHIYGNLSEVYEQMNLPDSAIYYSRLSLSEAIRNKSGRGKSTAYLNLASAFARARLTDSAAKYFGICRDAAIESEDPDVELNAYAGLANCAAARGDHPLAARFLKTGFDMIRQFPLVNSYYTLLFLESATRVYQSGQNFKKVAEVLKMKDKIRAETHLRNDTQIRNILMAGLNNETRILNLEVNKARQEQDLATTRLYFITASVLLLLLVFLAYVFYSRQRLRLSNLRIKISQDLHDEVGATLSGIALYAHLAQQQGRKNQLGEASASLDIINSNAKEMVKKLNDIVWAVNPGNDSFEQLMQRLEEYAMESGLPKGIQTLIRHDEELSGIRLSMEVRKNIYLIGIEAVNNAIKYSDCHTIRIEAGIMGSHLRLQVADDGKGFTENVVKKGNGLDNMRSRAKEINGILRLSAGAVAGTQVELICKIA